MRDHNLGLAVHTKGTRRCCTVKDRNLEQRRYGQNAFNAMTMTTVAD